jgi:predicted ArsR family transcriptional regulator
MTTRKMKQTNQLNMESTRERVLYTLLTRPRTTINELADIVGINPISVRHHINNLLAENLVGSEEEHHGVGRPRRVYFLTELGVEKFPSRYIRLTTRLLEQLKETISPQIVNQIFAQMAKDLARELTNSTLLDKMTIEQKLDLIKVMLQQEGFNIEWERSGNQFHITETSCPYYHVGQEHPEICFVDQELISSVLSTQAEKTKCILNGDSHCTYVISTQKVEEVN